MSALSISLRQDQYLELEKIGLGAFLPLDGFMSEAEFQSVCDKLRLPSGAVFPLPIVLDVDAATAERARDAARIELLYEGKRVGQLTPNSVYTCDKQKVARQVYGTADPAHPGVRRFLDAGAWFIGGKTELLARVEVGVGGYELSPQETRRHFAERGWKTVVGFQTRNVPHRAHEYLQRVALEHVDGLFIQPLVGQKKAGDYTLEAIMTGYQALVDGFYPSERVLLGVLSTSMRYAGPREAIFHALIRRNYGCTHFIVGRDHAGVGNYYRKYEAQELLRQYEAELGIKIMYLHGPFYCAACEGIVTEHTCPHFTREPEQITEISGTLMRSILSAGASPDSKFIRPQIVAAVRHIKLFIEEDAARIEEKISE
jgi:sulfate adenylyltransferase